MAERDNISAVIDRCRFSASVAEIERTLPGAAGAIPPLTTVAFRDGDLDEAFSAYPVVPSPRLVELLTHFLADQVVLERDGGDVGSRQVAADPEQFQSEPYFTLLAQLVAKTRAHGTVFRLDSVLWIHLSQLIAKLLHPDATFLAWVRAACPGVREEALAVLAPLGAAESRGDATSARLRAAAARAVIARNEFANRTVSRMVGDERPNALQSALAANPLGYTLPPGFVTELDFRSLVAARDGGLRHGRLTDLTTALRSIIEDLFVHRDDRTLSGTEAFFVSQFFSDETLDQVSRVDPRRFPGGGGGAGGGDVSRTTRLGWSLVFRDEVLRYLISHVDQLNVRRALRGLQGRLSRQVRDDLERPERLRAIQGELLEVARSVRVLDLLDALRDLLVQVEKQRGDYRIDRRVLRSTTVPLDLGSYYELFRRNRSGTAVFIDLIGFTGKTRDLFFGRERGGGGGELEDEDRGELAALALERLFRVRGEIAAFSGQPEGFEGDAILDIFPDPLRALRYVGRFRDNFSDNDRIQFRPFSRPVANPFTVEGFRVGIATGDYTLVNVPDVDASGATRVRLRAIGPAINKASRLNTGKRGARALSLSADAAGWTTSDDDPLDVFRVRVRDQVLDNTGVCLDRTSFEELRAMVRRADLPRWQPRDAGEFTVDGRDAVPRAYRFDLLFRDPDAGHVFAVRRLPSVPHLKGLSQGESVVYEALVFRVEEYLAFLDRDAGLDAARDEESQSLRGPRSRDSRDGGAGTDLVQELPDYFYGRRAPDGDAPGRPPPSLAGAVAGEPSSEPPVGSPGSEPSSAAPADSLFPEGDEDGALRLPTLDEDFLDGEQSILSIEDDDAGGDEEEEEVLFEDWTRSSEEQTEDTDEGFDAALQDMLDEFESLEEDLGPPDDDAGGPAYIDMDAESADPDGSGSPPAEESEWSASPSGSAEDGDGVSLDGDGGDPDMDDYYRDFLARYGTSLPGKPDGPTVSAASWGEPGAPEPSEESGAALRVLAEDGGGEAPARGIEMASGAAEPPPQVIGGFDVPSTMDEPSDGDGAWPEEPEPDVPLFLTDASGEGPAPDLDSLSEPSGSRSLLGALGDDVAERLARAAPPPGFLPRFGVPEPRPVAPVATGRRARVRVPIPALDDVLRDYHLLLGSGDEASVITVGRLARGTLFDVHRYRVPDGTPVEAAVEQVVETLLFDKIQEDFLPQCGWYLRLPEDGPRPSRLPMDLAARLLVAIV